MKINFANGLSKLNKNISNNNFSKLRLNVLKNDTVSFSSKNLYGADYSDIEVNKDKTIIDLIAEAKNGINVKQNRNDIILKRIRTAERDAKKFISAFPRFDYNDICQDLILIMSESTDREINGLTSNSMIEYAKKKKIYFEKLLHSDYMIEPMGTEQEQIIKAHEEEKIINELKTEELNKLIKDVISALTLKDRKIVISLFGLDGEKPKSLEKTGNEFNMTRERTRQIFSRAARLIHHPANKDYIENSFILNDMDI